MSDETTVKKIKDVPDELLFRCKTCTTEQDEKWLSWNKAEKQKIDGERFGLFCPECKNKLGIYSTENEVDLSKIKKSLY